jgi:hypothetical protein
VQVHVATPKTGPRDGFDLALLLTEVDRALRDRGDAAPAAPLRSSDLTRRAWLLVELELDRAGPIEIERNGQQFSDPDLGPLPCRYLTTLVRAMEVHGVERIRLTAPLGFDDFARFEELLALPTADRDEMHADRFPGRLYESSKGGIEVNGVARPHDAATPERDDEASVLSFDSSRAHGERRDAETPTKPTSAGTPAWPALEEDPLEAPAMVMKGERLRLSLRELDRCDDDLLYDALLDRIAATTEELWSEGHREEGYRALLLLTAHASGAGDRPCSHVLMAQSALQRLADDDVVRFVIDRGRVCESDGIRPTQLLLELGERPAAAILESLHEETDPACSQQLVGMLLALGDNAVPALARAISRREGARLQRAVRLAGELQNPKLVPPLASVFGDSGPALRREAANALAAIGNGEALDVLFRALGSGRDEKAVVAANALATSGQRDVCERLGEALTHAIERNQPRVAAALVRALGQQDDPPASFLSLLERVFDDEADTTVPKALRAAAIDALTSRRDGRAERWLLAATRDPDAGVSKRAHALLNARDRGQD